MEEIKWCTLKYAARGNNTCIFALMQKHKEEIESDFY